ncbi:sodium:calcium antiporter [Blastococcus saxobsidens]|uniref:Putative calcium/sodium:proton antiporter n=1 Tax=Blastococcus saxobsidens (strain DD2) TaxID=1146883 RepID=H6RQW5_BLASD|nr:calcium/sodium:proton antiporter [Blastococcus saxobsidens]CCG02844.1 putative calcium/sodium:proton antiporter [Blastococcus saxobsidens DD2]
MVWLWVPGLIVAAFATRWGAEQLAAPLKAVRRRYGFTGAAGGPLVALGSASPDVGINTVSAVTGTASIGLGSMLGSTVVSIPITVAVAFAASRKNRRDQDRDAQSGGLTVEKDSVLVDALPYLATVAVFALLVLPAPWRGLQLIDGVIAVLVYVAFLTQALLRGRGGQRGEVSWSTKQTLRAVAGVAVLAVGSYILVTGTRQIGSTLGLQPLVSGLFITAFMTALPQVFTTWSVVRSGQVTSGVTSVFADHAMTFTLAVLPLAIVGVSVDNYPIVLVVMGFVALMPILFAVLSRRHKLGDQYSLLFRDVLVFGAAVVVYIAVVGFMLVVS